MLYLSVGRSQEAVRTIATPEGHAVGYDGSGAVIGMVLLNVRFLLQRDSGLTVTIPPDRVIAAKIEPALIAPDTCGPSAYALVRKYEMPSGQGQQG